MQATRTHDDAMVEIIREDPLFADEYIAESLRSIDEPGGVEALFAALRQVARAQGLDLVAERSGVDRENLELALSTTDSPLIRSILAVVKGAGLQLAVIRPDRQEYARA